MERVWKSLNWEAKFQLAKLILNGLFSDLPKVNSADVEKIDSDDAVDAMTKQLTTAFPQVSPSPFASICLHLQVKKALWIYFCGLKIRVYDNRTRVQDYLLASF